MSSPEKDKEFETLNKIDKFNKRQKAHAEQRDRKINKILQEIAGLKDEDLNYILREIQSLKAWYG